MLHLPGFYYVKKPKRFVILCSDKSSERNLSCFFDMRKPRKMEHLHKEEPFSSDPYFSYQTQKTKTWDEPDIYLHSNFFQQKALIKTNSAAINDPVLKSIQIMVRLHIFQMFSFLAKMLSFLLRSDNIFARSSSYGPLAYFSNIFISGKNVVTSQQKWQHFCQKWKYRKNMQIDHNLNGL